MPKYSALQNCLGFFRCISCKCILDIFAVYPNNTPPGNLSNNPPGNKETSMLLLPVIYYPYHG